MVIVNYAARRVRDYFTTLTDFLTIGSTTTETISITSSSISDAITTIPKASISYPTDKKFTAEYVINSLSSNGTTFRRIASKETTTTTMVISLNNIPRLDKNNLIEVAFDSTFIVENE